MESGEASVKFVRTRAALGARLKMLDFMMDLDSAAEKNLHLSSTDRWYLLLGRDCPDLTEHYAFEVREGRSPGFFILVYGAEAICVLVCSALHAFALYWLYVKKELAELLRLEEVTILMYSCFHRTCVRPALRMRLAILSKCTIPQVPHFFCQ